ncbi:MAG: PD-(D/E)XK nuclease family protein, partial [Patescibacteria group bacterium]|nr:PD-(D/E)XK nuclease family protein [Patescibacteria group bacterium]
IHGYALANRNRPPPLVVEFPFEIDWMGHELVGIIDRIDEDGDALVLTDYKSGKRKPSRRELRGDLQLTVYAFAIERIFGRAPDRIVYYHLRTQEALPTWRGPDDFVTLRSAVLPHVLEAIDAALFPPSYGWECKRCEFRERCLAEGPDGFAPARREQPNAFDHHQIPPVLGRPYGPGPLGLPRRLPQGS